MHFNGHSWRGSHRFSFHILHLHLHSHLPCLLHYHGTHICSFPRSVLVCVFGFMVQPQPLISLLQTLAQQTAANVCECVCVLNILLQSAAASACHDQMSPCLAPS